MILPIIVYYNVAWLMSQHCFRTYGCFSRHPHGSMLILLERRKIDRVSLANKDNEGLEKIRAGIRLDLNSVRQSLA